MTPDDPASTLPMPSDRLGFDTAGLTRDEALARYRTLDGVGADVFETGPDFQARVEGWRLDRMLLYDRRLNDIGHRRAAERTATDGFSHYTVTLLLDGMLDIDYERDGAPASRSIRPGEVLLIDTHRPGSNRMRHARVVTLAVARTRMLAIAGQLDGLHGLVLGADEARLYREFVESLLRNLAGMAQGATMAAAAVLATLVGIAIDSGAAWRQEGSASRDAERLAALRRLVDRRLADPRFDADAVIGEADLSRTTLYRLLKDDGGLATFIRHRRLEQLRRWLGDPREPRPFADLVHGAGLSSPSHASRAFVARFGIRPSDYRELAEAGSGDDAFVKMRLWQQEVR